MPWWAIFISVPAAILLGYILERFFDAPLRKWLRGGKKAASTKPQVEEQKDQDPTEKAGIKNENVELDVPHGEATAEEEVRKGND